MSAPTQPERGNSRTYTVSRLKKNRPDLFQQVVEGKLSAHAAAVQAGFAQSKQVYLGTDTGKVAAKILAFTDERYVADLSKSLTTLLKQ